MFVVRKPFRNGGQIMLPGSVVEPGSIKWFKTRLKDHVIIEVNAHNFEHWKLYFINRYGIELKLNAEVAKEQPEEFITEEPTPKETIKRVVATIKK